MVERGEGGGGDGGDGDTRYYAAHFLMHAYRAIHGAFEQAEGDCEIYPNTKTSFSH